MYFVLTYRLISDLDRSTYLKTFTAYYFLINDIAVFYHFGMTIGFR